MKNIEKCKQNNNLMSYEGYSNKLVELFWNNYVSKANASGIIKSTVVQFSYTRLF